MSKARELANLGNVYDDGALSNRNMVVNGSMIVAQRGTSTSITSAGSYFSPDRFEVGITATDQLAATLSQSTVAPDGFANSLKFEVTTAETTLDADEIVTVRQKFEGQDLQRIAKGTASAQQVTASFWVRSSNTGTYILELYDSDNTRQVSKSYTINSANTWEYKTITFPADTTGAFNNDNNLSLFFMWWLAAGSNYTSGALNTSWASATTANRVVGQTNLIASTNDFYLTGVQLEVGDTATPFEHRSYGDELARCQRYFLMCKPDVASGITHAGFVNLNVRSTTARYGVIHFPVSMRVRPSLAYSGSLTAYSGSGSYAVSAISMNGSSFHTCEMEITAASGATVGDGGWVRILAGAYVEFDAEL
jgi:hypothetical protein